MNGAPRRVRTMSLVPRPRGTIVTALMVMLGMALLGAVFASTVDAAPIKTKASISSRVQSQTELCELGGGEIEASYGYENGKLTSAQTVCNGGSDDGRVCSNTATTTDCYKRPGLIRPTESVVPGQRPDSAAPGENPRQTLPVVDDIAVSPGGVAEDPTGDEQARIAEDEAAEQAAACQNAGGTGTVIDNRSAATIDVRCTGGVLDGMVCRNGHYETVCDVYRSPAGSENPATISTGEIELVQVESMVELEDAVRGVAAEVAEDPTGTETVVIYNQSGSTVTDNATNQVLLCRGLGGTETVDEERTVGGGLESVLVRCKGGLLDGLICDNQQRWSACWWYDITRPEQDPRVTPAGGIEAPAEDAPTATTVAEPTVAPTEVPPAPSEPTTVPTDVPVEPTVAPTDEPGLPTVPTDDNTVPPGEAEDPTQIEPTPTEVVLL